jgi:hypothetical protein
MTKSTGAKFPRTTDILKRIESMQDLYRHMDEVCEELEDRVQQWMNEGGSDEV